MPDDSLSISFFLVHLVLDWSKDKTDVVAIFAMGEI